ncbi:hypothetical protein PaG_05206 [Moesziomyces aphidis]|uniref:Cullin family profile domain-containing protein n=1 Tax=Moesziomyces aphidis TaxID=84754 RepID=W3VI95_MOEAP|nr:hypothetical protein PaG_05206 [Moesziomyces aphidis]
MSLAGAWQQAVHGLLVGRADAAQAPASLATSADAYLALTAYLEPRAPSQCRFFDSDSGAFRLDSDTSSALQTLLEQHSAQPSSSKSHLSTPSPVVEALSANYTQRCLRAFDAVAADCGLAVIDDSGQTQSKLALNLPGKLAAISTWLRVWISPYSPAAIFDGLHEHRYHLLRSLQDRLRPLIDAAAVEALQVLLEQLVAEPTDVDLSSCFVAHVQLAGVSSIVLTLLGRVVQREITRKVQAVVDAVDPGAHDQVLQLESAARPVLQQWLDEHAKPRVQAIRQHCFAPDTPSDDAMQDSDAAESAAWLSRLDVQLDEALCATRANQLFDLVAMYPESAAALQDLRLSLQTADQRLSVARRLAEALQMRLLHPGAHTRDIIQMYVHLVRALREMDATGVVLSRVVSPLRRYLRARKDTVRVIVASMLGDDPDFTLLKDELERADDEEQAHELDGTKRRRRGRRSLQTAQPAPGVQPKRRKAKRGAARRRVVQVEVSDSDASSDEDWDDPDWVPKPMEAGSGYRMSTSKDILSMLTSIFDDRTGFIAALEKSMADQLVHVKAYKAMDEYRNNMILKKRFGDKNMGKCDVMLGDVTESRRIDSEIHHRRRSQAPAAAVGVEGMVSRLHPLIVSRQFWPEPTIQPGTAGVGDFTLPPLFGRAQEEYGKTFSQTKAMRKLHWLNHLGSVELEVELDSGQSIAVECSLLQAAVLEVISRAHAAERTERPNVVTQSDVMDQLNLQREADAADALNFWLGHGLIQPLPGVPDAFVVQSSLPDVDADADADADAHSL